MTVMICSFVKARPTVGFGRLRPSSPWNIRVLTQSLLTTVRLVASARRAQPSEPPAIASPACLGQRRSHVHAPWGKTSESFSTPEEAAYPPLLAAEIANTMCNRLTACGWTPSEATSGPQSVLVACRAAANDQPRASRFPAQNNSVDL